MHYSDVLITTTPEGAHIIIAKVMHSLHQLLPRSKGRVGLAFPGWTNRKIEAGAAHQAGSLGRVVRLIGPEADLEDIVHSPALKDALGNGWHGVVMPVKPIPADARPVRYIRDRTREKDFDGFARRAEARCQRNGRTFTPRSSAKAKENINYILLRSYSSNQRYPLFIRREPAAEQTDGQFNRYGLSRQDGPTAYEF